MARTTTEAINPTRSAQMAKVRGRDTKPEIRVRKALHSAGLRFRLHAKDLPGRPDIVFRSRKIAIFVHGCFWHRHDDPACKLARLPKTRLDFWLPKLDGNHERDARNIVALEAMAWTPLIVWECETKHAAVLTRLAEKVANRSPIRSD